MVNLGTEFYSIAFSVSKKLINQFFFVIHCITVDLTVDTVFNFFRTKWHKIAFHHFKVEVGSLLVVSGQI